ncbi:MAG: YSC84-related protein [Gammaproteobacteria bacterium]
MKITGYSTLTAVAIAVAGLGLGACTATTSTTSGQSPMAQVSQPSTAYPQAHQTMGRMVGADPSMRKFLKNAYGYAVFPTVSKGALIVGGTYGQGGAFRNGKMVAKCSIAKGSIGFQIGGKAYSEVIFFKSKPYFDKFVNGNFSFDTGVSAVAANAGAAANVSYNKGVAVFSLPKGGLIASASVGGQNFSCKPAHS